MLQLDSLQTHAGQLALAQHDGELASQPLSPQLHGLPLLSLHVSSHEPPGGEEPPAPVVVVAVEGPPARDDDAASSTDHQLSASLNTLVASGPAGSTVG
jgi:hypothetical protein